MSNAVVSEGQSYTLDENGIYRCAYADPVHYPDGGNDSCFEFEDKSFWFKHRNDIICSLIRRFGYQGALADIGGGNGFQAAAIAREFPDKDCLLVEPGYKGCLNGRRRGLSQVYNMTSNELDFQALSVGAVGLFDVLEHIEDHEELLRSLWRALPQGGKVFITVPAHQALWSRTDEVSGHFRRYNVNSLQRVAEAAGFNGQYFTYFFHYAPLPLYLGRVLRDKLKSGPASDEELLRKEAENLNAGGSLGSLLVQPFHSLERFLVKFAHVPLGASLAGVLVKGA